MNNEEHEMESLKAYKFRIYPDAKRQAEIDESIVLAQKFYNKLLEKSTNGKISRQSFNKYLHGILLGNPEYHALYSQTRQDIRDRLQTKSHAWGDSASTMQKAWRAESLNQEHTPQHAGEAHSL